MNEKRIERVLAAQAETGQTINRLLLILLGLGALGGLIPTLPDVNLLATKTTVSTPFGGATSFKVLVILVPVILIAVRLYIEIYLRHWRRLDDITRRFRMRRVPRASPLLHPLLRVFSVFVLYALLPLVLAPSPTRRWRSRVGGLPRYA